MVLIVNKTPQSMLIGRILVPPITPIALREDRFVMEKINSLVATGEVEIINTESEPEVESESKRETELETESESKRKHERDNDHAT